MPGGRSRAPAALTREKILAEGGRVFRRRGYRATTLDEIARALGVTKAALYHHVRGKDDLFAQVQAAFLDLAMESVRRATAASSSPAEQLQAALADAIEAALDGRGALAPGPDATPPAGAPAPLAARGEEYERAVAGIIEAGVAQGVFVACDPALVGAAVLAVAASAARWGPRPGPGGSRDVARVLSAYLVRGLEKQPALDTLEPARRAG